MRTKEILIRAIEYSGKSSLKETRAEQSASADRRAATVRLPALIDAAPLSFDWAT